MIASKIKNDIFAAFLEGNPIRHLSLQFNVSSRTICRWSAEEGWVKKRKQFYLETTVAAKENLKSKVSNAKGGMASDTFDILLDIIAERAAFNKGQISKNSMRYKTRDLCLTATALTKLIQLDLVSSQVLIEKMNR